MPYIYLLGALIRREAKMVKVALIGLVMVLGLSGCASFGESISFKQNWAEFWRSPAEGTPWEPMKQDWGQFWKSPAAGTPWESIKENWAEFWRSPAEGTPWESMKQDWAQFWN
jgi:rubredoxin